MLRGKDSGSEGEGSGIDDDGAKQKVLCQERNEGVKVHVSTRSLECDRLFYFRHSVRSITPFHSPHAVTTAPVTKESQK